MAKNKALIDQYKYVYKQTHQITPAIYASMAMALHRVYGFGFDRIDKVFSESQKIWETHNGNMDGMLEKCYEETGIELRNKNQIGMMKNEID